MSCINHEIKSIFIHIPKCAGSSMTDLEWNKGNGHTTLQDFFVDGKKKRNYFWNYYKWCFVRNPWDRAVSAWDTCSEIKKIGFNTFEKFINAIYKERKKIQNLPNVRWSKDGVPSISAFKKIQRIHFCPVLPILKVDNVIAMDFIGRYENINQDWRKLGLTLQLKGRGLESKLPESNTRKEKEPYQNYYNDELINKVGEIYKEDVEAFGYDYDI